MADTKVSALTAVSTLTGASEIPVNEGGTSKKATVTQIVNSLNVIGQTATKTVANDHSVSSTTATVVADLTITLVAGTYAFKYFLICQSATSTVGLTFAVNYTGTATRIVYVLMWPDTGTTAVAGVVDDASNATGGQIWCHNVSRTEGTGTPTISTGTGGVANTDVDLYLTIEGVLVASDGGDLELYHGSETATATRVEGPGSSLFITRTA